MRFKIRLIFSLLAFVFITSVSVIHILLRQFEGNDNLSRHTVDRQKQQDGDFAIKQQQGLLHANEYYTNDAEILRNLDGGESQIFRPPLHRTRKTRDKINSSRNETKSMKSQESSRRQVGTTMTKAGGWDDQEIIGHGHPWQQFHHDIHKDALYHEGAPYMADLLHDLATARIVNVSLFIGGSQAKLDVRLADGNRAIVKPMRSSREFVYKYNKKEPFWLDQERHNAEIASFHLDKIFDFRRVCPCVGRLINLTQEVLLKSQDQELLKTFFWKDGNLCFIGKCAPWFCNEEHPICARGDQMEISLCQFLPSYKGRIPVFELEYPWSQGVKESKVWKGRNVCKDYLKQPSWTTGRYFLDVMEQGIFDFFLRNYDRHHFDMLRKFQKFGFVVFLDNGKGFGNPNEDDITFLAPVYQCCKVRRSTYLHFKGLTRPKSRLSDLLRSSMSNDPLAPVLTEDHLLAMDRRLKTVLQTIDECIRANGEDHVLIDRL